jgi:hypothetical protein
MLEAQREEEQAAAFKGSDWALQLNMAQLPHHCVM